MDTPTSDSLRERLRSQQLALHSTIGALRCAVSGESQSEADKKRNVKAVEHSATAAEGHASRAGTDLNDLCERLRSQERSLQLVVSALQHVSACSAEHHSKPLVDPTAAAFKVDAEKAARSSNNSCKIFRVGACRNGATCPFSHCSTIAARSDQALAMVEECAEERAVKERAAAHAEAVRAARESWAARLERVEQAEAVLLDTTTASLQPLRTRIGLDTPRRDRGEFKAFLEQRFELEEKGRDTDFDARILCGDVSGDGRDKALLVEKPIVSLLLSSTFTDTEWERNLLIDDVVPYLQEFSRHLKMDFRLVEMRWGIRKEASTLHQTSEICMSELERCLRESQGYFYVFLGAQKYGFRPFPAKIPQAVFESLFKVTSDVDRPLLEEYFRLDTNVAATVANHETDLADGMHDDAESPGGAVYVLQSSEGIKDWWSIFTRLQIMLRKAAKRVWQDKMHLLRDPSSRAYMKKFFISVTEEEFSRGLLWVGKDDQQNKTLVFRRTFQDLNRHAADKEANKFLDLKGSRVDEEAQQFLDEFLQMVPECVKSIVYDPLEWGPGIDPSKPAHASYLRKFLDDFCQEMMKSIVAAAQKLAIKPDVAVDEAIQHLRFALLRAQTFTSTTSTQKVQSKIQTYLTASDNKAENGAYGKAYIVCGQSGAGKTYIMCKIAADCITSHTSGFVVMRFLGTTPLSSNMHVLLDSLCEQLRRAYKKNDKSDEVPSDFKGLRSYFYKALTMWPTSDKPLTLFIDSVDQLDDSNGGRRLDWLPVSGLSVYVKLVVSTMLDYAKEFQCLSILEKKLGHSFAEHIFRVNAISEHDQVLIRMLKRMGRNITKQQLHHVSAAFDKRTDEDAAGTPLWLTIVAQTVSLWASYDCVPFAIQPSVRYLIIDLFVRLQKSHGEKLVRATLAYITLSKGISEMELKQLLSLVDDVLADVYEWWVPPVRILPLLLVTRLLSDLAPYLTRRGEGSGAELVSWYHRQFWEAALVWLFPTRNVGSDMMKKRHKELADYFSGMWNGKSKMYNDNLKKCVQRPEFFPDETAADRMVQRQPLVFAGNLFTGCASKFYASASKSDLAEVNTRRLHKLVHHVIKADCMDRAVQELMSPEYIAAKFAIGDGASLMGEYAEAMQQFPAAALDLGKCMSAVGANLKLLEQQPPLFALQICFQQPDQHPLCVAAKHVIARLSAVSSSPPLTIK